MAARGFRDVGINGSANGAGVVLPESGTLNMAIEDVGKNGILNSRAAALKRAQEGQVNKDFATNKLKVPPTIQYQGELNNMAKQWYDKGVGYRRQGFDPFNADYSNPTQAAAAQEYLAEKQHIEQLADLAKNVSDDFKAKQKLNEEGKLEGWEDYTGKLHSTKLADLYQQGGVNALPELHKPFDLADIDKSYHLAPQVAQMDQQVAPGVVNKVEHKYVNIPQAAHTYEQLFNSQPGSTRYLTKKGIGDPKQLFTYGGHNMMRDPQNNPEDFGHIDEPGIYHQMVSAYLTEPDLIKQLPQNVKTKILNNLPGVDKTSPWVGGNFNQGAAVDNVMGKPQYLPTEDPDFKQFVDKKFDQQIQKERAYQGEILNGVMRKVPSVQLGDTQKMDATMANLALHKQSVSQGWQRLGIAQQNAERYKQQYAAKMKDVNSREKWVNDIQSMNPDAIKTLSVAIQEIPGADIEQRNGGIRVTVPETVDNFKQNAKGEMVIDDLNKKKQITTTYEIDKFTGKAGRLRIMQLLNKLPSVGKEKVLKTEEYNPSYNDIGGAEADQTVDDL